MLSSSSSIIGVVYMYSYLYFVLCTLYFVLLLGTCTSYLVRVKCTCCSCLYLYFFVQSYTCACVFFFFFYQLTPSTPRCSEPTDPPFLLLSLKLRTRASPPERPLPGFLPCTGAVITWLWRVSSPCIEGANGIEGARGIEGANGSEGANGQRLMVRISVRDSESKLLALMHGKMQHSAHSHCCVRACGLDVLCARVRKP